MRHAYYMMSRACSSLKAHAEAFTLGLSLVSMALLPCSASGQWTAGSGGTIYYNGGNVGIGTNTPNNLLHVRGSGWTPQIKLENTQNYPVYLNFVTSQGTSWIGPGVYSGPGYTNNLQLYASGGIHLNADGIGKIGIGTPDPQYLLSVNGTIGTKDVIVTNSGWPDYVFRAGYRLRPLSEVNAYIQAHRHLPDIPTEAEVKEKGVSVGEMQAKLLAKIEELTLHMIQADERIERLERENRELREWNAVASRSSAEAQIRLTAKGTLR